MEPRTFYFWDTHDRETSYILNDLNCSQKAIITHFLDHVNETDADRAQLHFCGEGMAGGIDWVSSLAWHRSSGTLKPALRCSLRLVLRLFFCTGYNLVFELRTNVGARRSARG